MATPSTMNRSTSDFSNASVVALGRSTYEDVKEFSETSPLLGHSVQGAQAERTQGDCKIAIYSANYLAEYAFTFTFASRNSHRPPYSALSMTALIGLVTLIFDLLGL